ncbi:hypothetical protein [Clostridium vincentii]|uniref:ABC-2 family transporter protein n=1 Tax=Clostridium vincentii TaxID=52704 RepID=A0A2T0BB28_9CLOT|nr:hypothetical protein [Clostridium vincentii]PRR81084.1 hypothetical protein CLVI_27580 [Clostridium vincentii]
MKRLYNKALMYQFFYLGKWALFVSMIFYGIFTYGFVNSNLANLSLNISVLEGDTLDNLNPYHIIFLCLIIFLLYVVVTGFNKRNNMTFLTSGPYTKEEIKKNEILFLIISLLLLIFTFIYINICLYVRDNTLLLLASNEYTALFSNIMRLVIVGTAFIAYLTFMDMLFSNTIISILAMIGTPVILAVNLLLLNDIANRLNSFHLYNFNLVRDISHIMSSMINFIFGSKIIYESIDYIAIIILLMIIVVTFIITWRINKSLCLNKINNFFVFPIVEKIVFFIISFTISLVFIYLICYKYTYYYNYNTTTSVKGTIITLTLISICVAVSYVIKNLLSKLFKDLINK